MQEEPEAVSQRITPNIYGKALTEPINQIVKAKNFRPFISHTKALLLNELQKAQYSPFGLEVIFAYVMLKINEIENIRTILKGKTTNLSKEKIKETLPYGTI